MIIIFLKSTVCSQNISTKKDSLCFSLEQAKIIFKDIKKGEICDSISQNQALQIINFKSIVINSNEQKLILNNRISDLEKNLNKTKLKLKISKKLTTFGLPTFLGVGLFFGFILSN